MITSVATDSQAFFTHWRQRSLSGALYCQLLMHVVHDLFEGGVKFA